MLNRSVLSLSDISLAAFGRKEIEIAEVILIDIVERTFFTSVDVF